MREIVVVHPDITTRTKGETIHASEPRSAVEQSTDQTNA
jgi:hypothetical protein